MFRVTLQTQNKVHRYNHVETHPIFADFEGTLEECLERLKLWRKKAPKSRIFLAKVSRFTLSQEDALLLADIRDDWFIPRNVEHLTSIAEFRSPQVPLS